MTCRSLSVSVAMATYNGEAYLREQLQSILAQSYPADEIIICDDCSSDGTVAILEEFQQKHPEKIHVYRNPQNLGYVKNFEQAISYCTRDVIALSDQDDVWLPAKLERIVETFSHNPDCGLICANAQPVNASLHPVGGQLYGDRLLDRLDVTPEKLVARLLGAVNIKGCTVAFRRRFCASVLPIAPKGWGHDHWVVFLAAAVSRVCFVREVLMLYRLHGENLGNDPRSTGLVRYLRKMPTYLSIESYKADVAKWEQMAERLHRLYDQAEAEIERKRAQETLAQVYLRIEFARKRYELRRQNRLLRLVPAVRLLRQKQYQQYTRGFRTFVRDLFA